MSVNKQKNGKWLCQIDRKGIARVRKTFSTQSEAETFEREYVYGLKPRSARIDDPRTMIELIDIYYKYHSVNFSDSEKFKRQLIAAAVDMGNPLGYMLTPELFVKHRFKRTNQAKKPVTAKTFNNLHGSLSAMYNRLIKLKIIHYDNPIAQVEKLKIQERQMTYLLRPQIDELLAAIKAHSAKPSTWYVANLCLRTGCRWGEAEQLRKKQLHGQRVTFEITKSKRVRTIPLSKGFYDELQKLVTLKSPEERVFEDCWTSFEHAIKYTGISLPKGQLTHVLRHSFASHFMMGNGNILTLQNILGHSDIKMTMRYAHLAPSHLNDAVTLNPLS